MTRIAMLTMVLLFSFFFFYNARRPNLTFYLMHTCQRVQCYKGQVMSAPITQTTRNTMGKTQQSGKGLRNIWKLAILILCVPLYSLLPQSLCGIFFSKAFLPLIVPINTICHHTAE